MELSPEPSQDQRFLTIELEFPDPGATRDTLRDALAFAQLSRATAGRIALGHAATGPLVPIYELEEPGRVTEFERELDTRIDLLGTGIQQSLDGPLSEMLVSGSSDKKIVGLLTRAGLVTIRDMIVAGAWAPGPVIGIGDKSALRLADAIRTVVPEIPLVRSMEPSDIARFCTSLDQVSLGAVPNINYANVARMRRVMVGDVRQGRAAIDMNAYPYRTWVREINLFAERFNQARRTYTG